MSILSLTNLSQQLPIYLMRVPAMLIAISVHESAHAFVSDKLGDPTAKNAGRISLNPLHHLDPIGVLMTVIFGVGWARPVMIETRNFKKIRPKFGMALSSLAGPVSNLILGFIGVFAWMSVIVFSKGANTAVLSAVRLFLEVFFSLNISLAVFNFIPVPPLDGSRILLLFLPEKVYFRIMRYEQYLFIALIILMVIGVLTSFISLCTNAIINGMIRILVMLPMFN